MGGTGTAMSFHRDFWLGKTTLVEYGVARPRKANAQLHFHLDHIGIELMVWRFYFNVNWTY
jgi:hypothetical protein